VHGITPDKLRKLLAPSRITRLTTKGKG
jgi:hypothetical protein